MAKKPDSDRSGNKSINPPDFLIKKQRANRFLKDKNPPKRT